MKKNSNQSLREGFVFYLLTLTCWLRDSWKLFHHLGIRPLKVQKMFFLVYMYHFSFREKGWTSEERTSILCFHTVNQGAVAAIFHEYLCSEFLMLVSLYISFLWMNPSLLTRFSFLTWFSLQLYRHNSLNSKLCLCGKSCLCISSSRLMNSWKYMLIMTL